MPSVLFKSDQPRPSFKGSKYGVKDVWPAGEARQLDNNTAQQLVQRFPEYFEIQSTAAAAPTVDRAIKAPAKKAPAKRAAPKAKAKVKAKPKAKKGEKP